MGGDQGSRPGVLASVKFVEQHPDAHLLLFGDAAHINSDLPAGLKQIEVRAADQFVTMDDKPSIALRKKQLSSMALALDSHASGEAQAFVSGGNTGAIMAFGLQKLGTLAGVDRPAICKAIPTQTGRSFMLDLGANIDSSVQQLQQFALLGRAMAKISGCETPRIGILNVGVESHKGASLQQQLLNNLQNAGIKSVSFVEGDGIYRGDVDVIVCDGFTGNAVLKASEGAAKLILKALVGKLQSYSPQLQSDFGAWMAQFNPEKWNGAALLGLAGNVVKSHGSASEIGFGAALQVAYDQAKFNYLDAVNTAFQHH